MSVPSPQHVVANSQGSVSQTVKAEVYRRPLQGERPVDQRWAPRKSKPEKGHIFIPYKDIWIPCTVKNISSTGALLDISEGGTVKGNTALIPDSVKLVRQYFKEITEVDCRVVRKGNGEIGVQFAGPVRMRAHEPVKQQARTLKAAIRR